ncbi:MAG: trypsin-like peptidase domain-containing protein [Candidatus Humimicrobiia bacterium]
MDDNNYIKYNRSSNFLRGCLIVLIVISILIIGVGAIFGTVYLRKLQITSPTEERIEKTAEKQETIKEKEITKEETSKEQEIIKSEAMLVNPVTEVAKKVQPSVVNITIEVIEYDIFGREGLVPAVGSGVIFSEDGYILTNAHVVEEAEKENIKVTFFDGKTEKAKLVGMEPRADIAVIKVDKKNLKAAEFISVRDIEVGDLAVAIGSPFGFQQTVTSGIVSALGREIPQLIGGEEYKVVVDLIQTDAAINMGNSGGALANIEGKVMGINTLIISPNQMYGLMPTSVGLGFAIPSDIATNIANQIIKYGKSRIPIIGIKMGDSTDPDVPGVFIAEVFEDLPAEKAGIKVGDIITKCNNIVLRTQLDLIAEIVKHNVGNEIELEINRNGKVFTTKVQLVDAPPEYGR